MKLYITNNLFDDAEFANHLKRDYGVDAYPVVGKRVKGVAFDYDKFIEIPGYKYSQWLFNNAEFMKSEFHTKDI